MSTVLLSLASAHHQGRSSTVMCRCPTRGDVLTAPDPEDRDDAQILHSVLGPEDALGQPFGDRGINDQLGCGLVFDRDVGRRARDLPRTLREGNRGQHGSGG